MTLRRIVALAIVATTTPAAADVRWDRGLVTATGIGIADRHAPSPASAREPARRAAEDAARDKLAMQVAGLPLATGSTVKSRLSDAKIKARIEGAVARAIVIESTPQTDGSWNVTMAVPIEAVRLAIAGPRAFDHGDADPPVVVVERVAAKPAVGTSIGGVAAPVLWVTEATLPSWARSAPRIKATGAKQGGIEVATKQGGPSTLFVLVTK